MNEPEILLNIIRGKAIPRNPDHTVKSSTTTAKKKKKQFKVTTKHPLKIMDDRMKYPLTLGSSPVYKDPFDGADVYVPAQSSGQANATTKEKKIIYLHGI